MDKTKETKKIDIIISKIQERIYKKGAYENAGQKEYRQYMDSLALDDYETRAFLSDYFQTKLNNLDY